MNGYYDTVSLREKVRMKGPTLFAPAKVDRLRGKVDRYSCSARQQLPARMAHANVARPRGA